ncbi:MAG: hypothetical protein MUE69_20700 [Myxococcota bacterium]|nr:hypothetical protein [Myxococcota bacterium]
MNVSIRVVAVGTETILRVVDAVSVSVVVQAGTAESIAVTIQPMETGVVVEVDLAITIVVATVEARLGRIGVSRRIEVVAIASAHPLVEPRAVSVAVEVATERTPSVAVEVARGHTSGGLVDEAVLIVVPKVDAVLRSRRIHGRVAWLRVAELAQLVLRAEAVAVVVPTDDAPTVAVEVREGRAVVVAAVDATIAVLVATVHAEVSARRRSVAGFEEARRRQGFVVVAVSGESGFSRVHTAPVPVEVDPEWAVSVAVAVSHSGAVVVVQVDVSVAIVVDVTDTSLAYAGTDPAVGVVAVTARDLALAFVEAASIFIEVDAARTEPVGIAVRNLRAVVVLEVDRAITVVVLASHAALLRAFVNLGAAVVAIDPGCSLRLRETRAVAVEVFPRGAIPVAIMVGDRVARGVLSIDEAVAVVVVPVAAVLGCDRVDVGASVVAIAHPALAWVHAGAVAVEVSADEAPTVSVAVDDLHTRRVEERALSVAIVVGEVVAALGLARADPRVGVVAVVPGSRLARATAVSVPVEIRSEGAMAVAVDVAVTRCARRIAWGRREPFPAGWCASGRVEARRVLKLAAVREAVRVGVGCGQRGRPPQTSRAERFAEGVEARSCAARGGARCASVHVRVARHAVRRDAARVWRRHWPRQS